MNGLKIAQITCYSLLAVNACLLFILGGVYGSPEEDFLVKYALLDWWKQMAKPWVAYFVVFGVIVLLTSTYGLIKVLRPFSFGDKERHIYISVFATDLLGYGCNFAIATLCCVYISVLAQMKVSLPANVVIIPFVNLWNAVTAEAILGVILTIVCTPIIFWANGKVYLELDTPKVNQIKVTEVSIAPV